MPVNFPQVEAAPLIQGVGIGTAKAHIRYPDRVDVVVFELAEGTTTEVITTTNAFCAAPVKWVRQHAGANPRFLLINTGNANAGTGSLGEQAVKQSCQSLAELASVGESQVWAFSTGVIGEQLPVDRLCAGLPEALADLSKPWEAAAKGIMTTDTVPKSFGVKVEHEGKVFHVSGVSKGAGMIRPNMATMLGFVATDLAVPNALLAPLLKQAADQSFNRITVDGDTSTNDCLTLSATGASGLTVTSESDSLYAALKDAVFEVTRMLAQMIVRDAEGATKFVSVQVTGGAHTHEAAQVAYAVAHSPLVKTALFASDPNWGRLLCAVGYAGVENLDVSKISVSVGGVDMLINGEPAPSYTEAQGSAVFEAKEIQICIDLARGQATDTVYTCDLSYDYVKINADYRS